MSPLVPYTEKGMNFSDLPEPDSPRNEPKQHLLYSVGNKIRLHLDDGCGEYIVSEQEHTINSLTLFNDRLICSTPQDLVDVEADETMAEDGALSLAVHDDRLICVQRHKILDAETKDKLWHSDDESIMDVAVYGGRLVHIQSRTSGREEERRYQVVYTEEDRLIADRVGLGHALCVHDDRLVSSEEVCKRNRYFGRIVYAENGELIGETKGDDPLSLASYNGDVIYAGGNGEIHRARDGRRIGMGSAWFSVSGGSASWSICSILPIGDKTASRLIKLHGVKRLK